MLHAHTNDYLAMAKTKITSLMAENAKLLSFLEGLRWGVSQSLLGAWIKASNPATCVPHTGRSMMKR